MASIGEVAKTVVTEWYRQWSGYSRRPTRRELAQAAALVEDYGPDTAVELVPVLVAVMREAWPDAVRFGSIHAYLSEAVKRLELDRKDANRRIACEANRIARSTIHPVRQLLWESLPESYRQRARESIRRLRPGLIDADDVEAECIRHLRDFIPA